MLGIRVFFIRLSDEFALLHRFGRGFDCTPKFGDLTPFRNQALLLRGQLDLLLGLGSAFRLLIFGLGSTGPLRAGGFALLPLTATSVVCSVVRVAAHRFSSCATVHLQSDTCGPPQAIHLGR